MLNQINILQLVIQGSIFVLVLAIWLLLMLIWQMRRRSRAEKIQSRLGLPTASIREGENKVLQLWQDGEVRETTVRREVRPTMAQRIEQLQKEAGWKTSIPGILIGLIVGAAFASVLLYVVTESFVLPILAPVLILLTFKGYLQYCISQRTELFERQLIDALELGARSLRAGHPLSGAFQLISEEIAEPVGPLFGEICEQEALGVSIPDALEQRVAQTHSPDMRIFAVSVIIQLRSGGNLAEMMERVTWVIRERMRINRRARVLTAEAQLSKWVLIALPIVLLVGLSLFRPEYMQPLYTTQSGQLMMVAGGLSMCIGSWIMSRMSVLKY
jgi:tight adherence protein B